MENKTSKYFKYAIGEIILVVIGILIALQLNTSKENKEKSELGFRYLTEMRTELQKDFFNIDRRIRSLELNIKNHEAALSTHNIEALPADSIVMILNPENLDFKISELTFNRMKNLGLSSLTDNDNLNSEINSYYNSAVVSLNLSLKYLFEELRKYQDYFSYRQDAIDSEFLFSENFEFPSLYKETREEFNTRNKQNAIEFIRSVKGRTLILLDLANKRYALRVLKGFKVITKSLLESIYEELKSKNQETEPLPEFPNDNDYIETPITIEQQKKYVGSYESKEKTTLSISVENNKIYIKSDKDILEFELIYSGDDKFFFRSFYFIVQFNFKNDKIISFTLTSNGKKTEYIKK